MLELDPTTPPHPAVARALDVAARASTDASQWRGEHSRSAAQGRGRTRRVAIGDPQAPISRFFQILLHNELLDESGWLAPDVHLVSMGDHFDFGHYEQRKSAGLSGEHLLSWLAAHPPDQVTLLAGNHDLGRVGELSPFSGDEFDVASSEAQLLYRAANPDPASEEAFFARYPTLPSVELAARDYSTFRPQQRTLVHRLLRERRLALASEFNGVLLCHAGVTREHLAAIGVPPGEQADAASVSLALNQCLQAAVEQWREAPGSPLQIPHLHRPGSRGGGEGGGILLHRPARPPRAEGATLEQAPDLFSRRYDPRRVPKGLIQVTGHVRDPKSRSLLGEWAADKAEPEGALRSLTICDEHVEYRRGIPQRAPGLTALLFTDGAMATTPPERYEILDLDSLQPLVR